MLHLLSEMIFDEVHKRGYQNMPNVLVDFLEPGPAGSVH